MGGNLNFPCGPDNIAVMRKYIGQRLLNGSGKFFKLDLMMHVMTMYLEGCFFFSSIEDLSHLCLACGNEYPYTEDKLDTWVCLAENVISFLYIKLYLF